MSSWIRRTAYARSLSQDAAAKGRFIPIVPSLRTLLDSVTSRFFGGPQTVPPPLAQPRRADLELLAELADQSKLRPIIDRVFPPQKLPQRIVTSKKAARVAASCFASAVKRLRLRLNGKTRHRHGGESPRPVREKIGPALMPSIPTHRTAARQGTKMSPDEPRSPSGHKPPPFDQSSQTACRRQPPSRDHGTDRT